MRCWDSNPQPTVHASPPITTRQRLLPTLSLVVYLPSHLWTEKRPCLATNPEILKFHCKFLVLQQPDLVGIINLNAS